MPNASPKASNAGSAASPIPPLPDALRALLGPALAVALVLPFAWWDPARNAWAALALALALLFDAAARLVVRAMQASREPGPGTSADFRGVASPLLMLGNAAWLGAAGVAAGAWLRPDLFPLLAAALAGLVAMGAFARLSLVRTVIAFEAAEREEAEDKAAGRGRGR